MSFTPLSSILRTDVESTSMTKYNILPEQIFTEQRTSASYSLNLGHFVKFISMWNVLLLSFIACSRVFAFFLLDPTDPSHSAIKHTQASGTREAFVISTSAIKHFSFYLFLN